MTDLRNPILKHFATYNTPIFAKEGDQQVVKTRWVHKASSSWQQQGFFSSLRQDNKGHPI